MPYLQNRPAWPWRFAGAVLSATVFLGVVLARSGEAVPTEKPLLETREDLRDLLKIWQWYVLPSAGLFDAGWYPFFPADGASERLLSSLVPGAIGGEAVVYVSEDAATGETFFLNAFGEIVDSLPAAAGYSPLWIAEDRGVVSSGEVPGYLPGLVELRVTLASVDPSRWFPDGAEGDASEGIGSRGTRISPRSEDADSVLARASEYSNAGNGASGASGATNGNTKVSIPVLSRSVVYVDRALGNDSLSGKAKVRSGSNAGPKKTVSAGLRAVRNGDRLVIREGVYGDRLDVRGKAVRVRVEGRVVLRGDRPNRVAAVPESVMKQNVSGASTGTVARVVQ